ncbi:MULTISPECIES: thermonuclease family protein [Oceanimonas]|uniref:Thermonuclease family protein n=1 Tax=Oceanimonas smirnovii TaxID=264574 RepID=A0ABW7P055_9GAMM|nr:thermonuclease family protein [Oceanimonas sp. CAM02]MDV2858717.1 thermonuclease family protein [Oceanimonas sp. CAM02]
MLVPALFFLLLLPFGLQASCPQFSKYETANVKKVIDGDTVYLADGRRIRLVGIDTPELYKNGRLAPEPGAEKAHRWLSNKLPEKSQMKLVFAVKRRDDYGRLLAYPLTNSGQLLVKSMLAAGLGELMLFEPNHKYWRCLLAAEQQARRHNRGIWSRALPATPVNRRWQHLLVTVQSVHVRHDKITLISRSGLTLHSGRRLPAIWRGQLARLTPGDRLFVRGEPRKQKAGWQLWLNQPWQFYREK